MEGAAGILLDGVAVGEMDWTTAVPVEQSPGIADQVAHSVYAAADAWGAVFWIVVVLIGLLILIYQILIILIPVFLWRIWRHSGRSARRLDKVLTHIEAMHKNGVTVIPTSRS